MGLEFGIHGYKPYKVTQVFARRFGDCKDKASLLIALAARGRRASRAGPGAHAARRRPRRTSRRRWPSSITRSSTCPKLDRYLDGTAEFSGVAELPAQDQGVTVLRVGAHGSVLTQTPVLPSSENHVERRWQVALQPSGDAQVDEELVIRGQAAPNWREHYQTEGERKDRYSRVWSGRFPGARLDAVTMPGIGDRNAPVTVRAGVTVPRLARASGGGGLELPVTGRDADFVRTYARLSARKTRRKSGTGWTELKPLDRDTLVAFYIKGRSLKQMVREFETPVGTIKRRLHVARNRLAPRAGEGLVNPSKATVRS